MYRLSYLFVLLICALTAHAGNRSPYFDNVDEVSGNVYCIYQDTYGYLWFGSKAGVTRYDGTNFKKFNTRTPELKLTDNYVQAISEDAHRNLWLGTRNGLNIVDSTRTSIKHIVANNDGKSLSYQEVRKVIEAGGGQFWIATYGGGLNLYDTQKGKFNYFKHDSLVASSLPGDNVNDLLLDSKNRLWVACEVGGLGLFNKENETFEHFTLGGKRSEYSVSSVAEGKDGTIWVGTWTRGLYKLNEQTRVLEPVFNVSGVDNPQNTIRRLLVNRNGSIWLGTLGGLGLFNPKTGTADFYTYKRGISGSLSGNAVWALYKDREDILWVGLLMKGLCFWDFHAHRFQALTNEPLEAYAPPKDAINAVYYSNAGKLWFSTREAGVYIYDIRQREYIDNRKLDFLVGHSVTDMSEDSLGNMWLTSDYGVYRYNLSSGNLSIYEKSFFHISENELGGIYSVTTGNQGDIYIGGWGTGFTVLSRSATNSVQIRPADFIHFTTNNSPLRSNVIWQVEAQGNGLIWVNTKQGVYIYNEKLKQLTEFTPLSLRLCKSANGQMWGLDPSGDIYKLDKSRGPVLFKSYEGADIRLERMLVDKRNQLWVSTSAGLRIVGSNASDSLFFDHNDGLPKGNPFWKYALLEGDSIALGTGSGIMLTSSAHLGYNEYTTDVRLNDLQIFGKSVDMETFKNEDGNYSWVFNHNQNGLSFFVSPMAFSATTTEYIYYKLKTEEHWHRVLKSNPKIHYPHLSSGQYSIVLKTRNTSGYESSPQVLLSFEILPPWWLTTWAVAGYALILVVILWLVFSYSLISIKARNKLEMESFKIEEQEKLIESRLRFFTNISHELKTPLTLIQGPVDQLVAKTDEGDTKNSLLTVQRNVKNLTNLVEELLEFRKVESGLADLKLEKIDLKALIDTIVMAFRDLAKLKEILFVWNPPPEALFVLADRKKITKAIYNLVINAFKFTPQGGTVSVSYDSLEARGVKISIQDSGPGINPELVDHIFEEFVSDNHNDQFAKGTGIGLSFVKQLVELHGGRVEARNNREGALFEITLPNAIVESLSSSPQYEEQIEQSSAMKYRSGKKETILIAEDNPEIRLFIKSLLSDKYDVVLTANGREALDVARRENPDIILSDVMMPEMDGLELCGKVKSDIALSHIPIILITALSSSENVLAGLKHKADDYVTKPFSADVVLLKIDNLLAARRAWKQKFKVELQTSVGESSITGADEDLLNKVIAFISENIEDPKLNVSVISKAVGVHRSNLNRKLAALTDFSPIEFITHVRMKKAMELLATKKLNVSEVAYRVGFTDPRYFSTVFKKHFGKTPSEA